MRTTTHRYGRVAAILAAGLMAFSFAAQAAESADSDLSSTLLSLKVKAVLLEKFGTDALHVDAKGVGSKITLTGTVSKRATRELSGDIAKSVKGVTSVDNDLKLAEYQTKEKVGAAVTETEREVKDGLLEIKVREALIEKLGAAGTTVGTDAASGTLTLEFPKDMTAAHRAQAEEAVKAVSGVVKVVTVDKKN